MISTPSSELLSDPDKNQKTPLLSLLTAGKPSGRLFLFSFVHKNDLFIILTKEQDRIIAYRNSTIIDYKRGRHYLRTLYKI